MGSLRLHLWSILGTVLVYLLTLWVDELLFLHSGFPRFVEWIYLPTGIRLLSTLLLGMDGAIGLLIAALLVDFCHYFPHDPVRAIAGAIISSAGPYAVYRLALERYGLKATLANLTPRRLLVLAFAVAFTNATLHHIWFALAGATPDLLESYSMMFGGDLLGALILLYIIKGLLRLLPAHSGHSRASKGLFRVRLALDSAYNNPWRLRA
ncbi:hypothetical protein F4827_005966 [Paraburkholderia bannensis]|uniref:MASE1 domain-containing protein n=1 Tax=Paraburkholderia bannensis TaxID=765414 RepID=A0A7W9U2Z7_9BURK|nr:MULTISPECIES: hypothetical protein [Paraburkholderia]MBB3261059.1 hypothetical protein [Paraburkholderia sp. WP4_3_2]MBB6106096.1 hypothetical protein [Paraburkholderia bannensis]